MSRFGAQARVCLSVIAGCAVLGAASVASAQESYGERPRPTPERYAAEPGLQLGARVGFTAGAGSVISGIPVTEASSGAVPVIIDAGWRIRPEIYVGAYGQIAPVLLRENPETCPQGFNCSARNWRVGIQADLHFLPRSRLDPYAGVGVGYEILHTTVNGTAPIPLPTGATVPGQVESSVVDRGWEYGNVSVGFDYRISNVVGLGPFATATLAQYNVRESSRTVTVAGNEVSAGTQGPIDHTLHAQFIVGLRGTFNP